MSDDMLHLDEVESTLVRLRHQRQRRFQNRAVAAERRVLVVDDDEDLLPLLSVVLEHAGFRVLSARDATQALEILHHEDVHVMLTDIMMPKISGTELVAAAVAYSSRIVPLVITGLPRINAAVESMGAGAQDFLVKPVEPTQLVERVERAWRRWLLGWQGSNASSVDHRTRVLLVENSASDGKLIERQLRSAESHQFSVVQADRLETAIELFHDGKFDVVLLNLDLPDSRGLETFATFRKAAGTVPVLALTDPKNANWRSKSCSVAHKTTSTSPT